MRRFLPKDLLLIDAKQKQILRFAQNDKGIDGNTENGYTFALLCLFRKASWENPQ